MGPRIDQFLQDAYDFLNRHSEQWDLRNDVELEATNRVMRVLVLDGSIGRHPKLVHAMCAIQHADGGWGERRDEPESRMRATAHCIQTLARANRGHYNEHVTRSILRGLDYLMRKQRHNGSWADHRVHELEVSGVAVGALLSVVGRERYGNTWHGNALRRGMRFIQNSRSCTHVWYRSVAASPVSVTANLLHKCVAYNVSSIFTEQSIEALLDMQLPEGYWDRGNIGFTCDVIRCALSCAGVLRDEDLHRRVAESSCRALNFVLDRVVDGGLGEWRTVAPDVIHTCGGIETVLELEKYFEPAPELLMYWQ